MTDGTMQLQNEENAELKKTEIYRRPLKAYRLQVEISAMCHLGMVQGRGRVVEKLEKQGVCCRPSAIHEGCD
jgi:hypothetical protein